MTREERYIKLNKLITCMKCEVSERVCDENCPIQYEAGNMGEIIENLEAISEILDKEPCEDSISRAEVIGELNRLGRNAFKDDTDYDNFFAFVDSLPPVTPTRKKGKWVNKSQKSGCGITFVASECTCCGKKTLFNCDELIYRFCPNCGAEMEGE